jgi:hypothetical protein
MSTFGEELRSQRLARGIALEEITAVTKISQRDWTDRFLKATYETGQAAEEDERGWTAFASNVGKDRIRRREALELRLRWAGAIVLLLITVAAGYLTVRYYGVRAGWWTTLLPVHAAAAKASAFIAHVGSWLKN